MIAVADAARVPVIPERLGIGAMHGLPIHQEEGIAGTGEAEGIQVETHHPRAGAHRGAKRGCRDESEGFPMARPCLRKNRGAPGGHVVEKGVWREVARRVAQGFHSARVVARRIGNRAPHQAGHRARRGAKLIRIARGLQRLACSGILSRGAASVGERHPELRRWLALLSDCLQALDSLIEAAVVQRYERVCPAASAALAIELQGEIQLAACLRRLPLHIEGVAETHSGQGIVHIRFACLLERPPSLRRLPLGQQPRCILNGGQIASLRRHGG